MPQESDVLGVRHLGIGSPTVRVNGRDVDPGAVERSDHGLKCRIYRSQQLGQSLVPPQQWIRDALEAARD